MITGHTVRRITGDQKHDRLTVEDHEGGTADFIIERSRGCDDPWKGNWPNGVHSLASDFALVLLGHRIPYIKVSEIPPPPGAGVAA